MFLTKPKQKEEELILVWIDLRFYFILFYFFLLIHTKENHEKMFIVILIST
jgi:hypothetical protein